MKLSDNQTVTLTPKQQRGYRAVSPAAQMWRKLHKIFIDLPPPKNGSSKFTGISADHGQRTGRLSISNQCSGLGCKDWYNNKPNNDIFNDLNLNLMVIKVLLIKWNDGSLKQWLVLRPSRTRHEEDNGEEEEKRAEDEGFLMLMTAPHLSSPHPPHSVWFHPIVTATSEQIGGTDIRSSSFFFSEKLTARPVVHTV